MARTVVSGAPGDYFEDKDALLMAILDGLHETERRAENFERGMATDFRGFFKGYLRHRMSFIRENREVFRIVLSEMPVNVELRELYLRQVVAPTMGTAGESFRSRMEQGEPRDTDAPLAMRFVAGSVPGVLILGPLGDEEVGSRSEEILDILAELLIHGLETTEEVGMYRSLNEIGSGKTNAPDFPDARFKANPYPFQARSRAEAPAWLTTLPDSARRGWLPVTMT